MMASLGGSDGEKAEDGGRAEAPPTKKPRKKDATAKGPKTQPKAAEGEGPPPAAAPGPTADDAVNADNEAAAKQAKAMSLRMSAALEKDADGQFSFYEFFVPVAMYPGIVFV